MKFTSLTYNISLVILIVTAIYTLIYSGLTGLLICSSVSLITAAFLDQFEIIVAISVFFAMFYIFFLKGFLRKLEPFQNQDIINRISKMKDQYHQVPQELKDPYLEPAGVYDPAIEGFADAPQNKDKPKEGGSSESTPASTIRNDEVDKDTAKEVSSAITEKEEFQSATNNLFKIGKMPSESADGPKLDAGSTLLKAMDSLNPDQIKSMSGDTKQLLETQKSLMGLLNQMRPVLADGKELLQTFSGMFGNGGPMKL
jgi:hypothetical protein